MSAERHALNAVLDHSKAQERHIEGLEGLLKDRTDENRRLRRALNRVHVAADVGPTAQPDPAMHGCGEATAEAPGPQGQFARHDPASGF